MTYRAGRVLGTAVALAATAVAARTVVWLAQGKHLTLGATPQERTGVLPGDDLVPHATTVATRAISIDAPAEAVRPWIA